MEDITGGSHAPGSGMLIELRAVDSPQLGEPLQMSFTYQVLDASGWPLPDTLVVNSHIESLRPAFELVSGDSAWGDTLLVGERTRTHSFVIRPLVRGARYNCVAVGAYLYDGLSIGDNDCLLIDTK
jgi:hypothetical protein